MNIFLPGRMLHRARRAPGALAVALAALSGCGPRQPAEVPAPLQLSIHVRDMLAAEWSSPEYFEALGELEAMGPELDAVLVSLARDPAARTTARANALITLAERRSSAAVPVLSSVLLTEEIPKLRIAAVLGLHRLADTSATAASALKAALSDPSRSVRLNALQALDIRDVVLMREILENDPDRDVREVAMQLVALAESRGAPLASDRRGALRTTGGPSDPAIVFRAALIDSVGGYATGDLRVELPQSQDLPLASGAEVVAGVVPAFFSPDRARVVYESDREIRVMDLASREQRVVGPGIAPRLVPFTQHFVFVREQEDGRVAESDSTLVRYWVYRGAFDSDHTELVGELTAVLRSERFANYSPVRWMVVGESAGGFVLRGESVSTFPLPAPVWRSRPHPDATLQLFPSQ